ncbi:adenylate kinase [Candidatus Uhrbacteria bacterium]|nr:adenylate kinase [Candidatus Uhrbacteria bacterium]MBD3284193.1 adenylate kinase [Candidatus Uhrbacteria bacterium]
MSKKRLRAIIFGPQGSGKGTQGQLLSDKFNLPLIGSGVLFRNEMTKGTSLGKIAEEYVKSGCLAPDELVNGIMAHQLKALNLKNGFLLDGYPRTVDQANFLQRILPINCAIYLKISDDEAVRRLLSRIQCPECKTVYNLVEAPPAQEGICSVCGGHLHRREDDTEDAIRTRLTNYHFMTEPLARYYRQKGALLMIKGDQSIEYVHEVLMKKLAKLGFTP